MYSSAPDSPSDKPTDPQSAHFVSLLWSLKRAVDQAPPGSVTGIQYVHFHALRKDETYRDDVLKKMRESSDPEIRSLAEQVATFRCVQRPSSGEQASETPEASGSASEKHGRPAGGAHGPAGASDRGIGGRPRGPRLVIVGLAAAALGAGIYLAHATGLLERVRQTKVEGSILEDTVWHSGHAYRLSGLVFVEGNATLSIEPGVRVLGDPGSALIVTRDARIHARGTAQDPIVFTSAKPVGERARGDWGGVILLGNAPVNTPLAHIEGIDSGDPRGFFGGPVDSDSCGIFQYVRIEYAGYEISKDNELNGLTLGGCGSGTILRFIQIHMGLDDGIELFGGAANLSHVVISRAADDALDWDRGWSGFGQFIVIQQGPDAGDSGIEADNLKADPNATPRSAPLLSNVTILGGGNPAVGQRGLVLRHGTAGDLRNVLIAGFTLDAIDIRDRATVEQIERGQLHMDGLIFADAVKGRLFETERGEDDDDGGFDEAVFFEGESIHSAQLPGRTLLRDTTSLAAPDFVPEYDDRLSRLAAPLPQGEFWDEAAGFVGAIRPGVRTTWLDGWTSFADN